MKRDYPELTFVPAFWTREEQLFSAVKPSSPRVVGGPRLDYSLTQLQRLPPPKRRDFKVLTHATQNCVPMKFSTRASCVFLRYISCHSCTAVRTSRETLLTTCFDTVAFLLTTLVHSWAVCFRRDGTGGLHVIRIANHHSFVVTVTRPYLSLVRTYVLL